MGSELASCGGGIFTALFLFILVIVFGPFLLAILDSAANALGDFRRKRKGLPTRAEEAAAAQKLAEAKAKEQEKEDALKRVLEDPELTARAKAELEKEPQKPST